MDKPQFNKKFGEFVVEQRKQRGWSQSELASRIGNNFQNISRMERGEINPTLYWFFRLSQVFEESYTDFSKQFGEFLQPMR